MKTDLWNLYKESEKGKKDIELFNYEGEYIGDQILHLAERLNDLGGEYQPSILLKQVEIFFHNLQDNEIMDWDTTRENFEKFIEDYELYATYEDENGISIDNEVVVIQKDKFRDKAAFVQPLSIYLYYFYDWFKPILFSSRFDIVQRNCDLLGIELPEIPRTNDYKTYCMYYYDICEAFNQFQQDNQLTDAELCACVYMFAPMLQDNQKSEVDLPDATNVWLTGTKNKPDFEFLDDLANDPSKESVWASNERTRKGDIVIMYCNAPRSYIHSIWRATQEGIFNPFDYYHSRSYLGHGVLCPKISFNDLKADPFLSQVPIVRKNLQGLKGVELTAKEYSELLRLMQEKGGDIEKLPKLSVSTVLDDSDIKIEKDVEEKILIPILKELGYKDEDWTRQLSRKAGRKEKAIPDFVFFPKGDKHFELSPFVIEAKYDMRPVTEQIKAFNQCRSYASMLRSKIMGICDKERLIIYKVAENGFSDRNKPIFEKHWSVIYEDADVKATLKQIIGSTVIKSLV